jgi:hypothetical protein
MFFSNRQFHNYINADANGYMRAVYKRGFLDTNFRGESAPSLTLKESSAILRKVKQHLANRELDGNNVGLGKWLRPWTVVPALKNFAAPEGDFGIGVEVEMGFTSLQAVRNVAQKIKDWKHITLDREGGQYPLEVTFPVMLYSKVSKRSQVMRYLDILNGVRDTVVDHRTTGGSVGTHINVSMGGIPEIGQYYSRMDNISTVISQLGQDLHVKYFGRRPYGYLYNRRTYIEFKLFNSQLDPKRLQQYIDIAVSLTKLVPTSAGAINRATVIAALEEGFNKSLPANVSVALPLAA